MIEERARTVFLRAAYALRGEAIFGLLSEIQSLQYQSGSWFVQYQREKLGQLIRYVCKNIAFYRSNRVCGMGLPGDVLEDFRQIPIVDRNLIISRLNDFLDKNQRVSWRSTSGSSGMPFIFPKDRNATGYADAVMHHVYGWHGIRIGQRQARLWGSALSPKGLALQWLKDAVLGRRRLSVFHCDDVSFSRYFAGLKWFQPGFFYAYANALYRFALYVENAGKDGKSLGISTAVCTGEMLLPHQRRKISEVFGCRVVNEYGSTENGIIGFECEAGSMHVMPTIYPEIENPDAEGYGSLLVTELNSRSVPFLRYRVGDIARLRPGACACGRPLPLMEIGRGRVNDQIVCPDGTIVYATIIAYILKDHVREFRALQHNRHTIELQIVPGQSWNTEREKKIRALLKGYLGKEMKVDFTMMEKIPPEKSGKLRYFISKLENL